MARVIDSGTLLAAAVAAMLCAAPASAQDDLRSNVTPYAPSFFAEYRPNTARDMIGRLPGFTFDGGGGSRGFAGNAGNVLIDGERPPSRGDSLEDVLSRLPASSVARIDIISGGAPGIDMQGRAIIANVIRKPEAGLTGSVYGSLDLDDRGGLSRTGKLQAQRQTGSLLVEGALNYNASEDEGEEVRVRRRAITGELLESGQEGTGFKYEQIEATASAESPLWGGRLRANGQASTQSTASMNLEALLFPGGANRSGGIGDRDAGELGLRYSRSLPAGFDLELVGFQSLYQSDNFSRSSRPAFSSSTESLNEGGETIGSVTIHSPAYGDWKFDVGTETALNWVESSLARTIDGKPLSLAGDTSRVEETRSNTHAVATYAPSPTLNVETGVNYEISTITAGPVDKSLSYIKPSVTVAWTPKAGHQLGLRVERVVDQLSFGAFQSSVSFNSNLGDTVFGVGNNELEPEAIWILDARYERRWGREGVFLAQVVHRRIDGYLARNVIPAPTATNPSRTFELTANSGDAERTTYSVSTALPLDSYGLAGGLLKMGVNIRTSSAIDPVTKLERRLSGDEPMGWNATLSQNVQALNLNWSLFANGGDEATSYSPRSISSYENEFGVGASVNWRPRQDLTLTAGVNNLNRGDDFDRSIFFTAPRNIGMPAYIEESVSRGTRSAYVSLRKNFS